jgi:bacterioferritin-associated ferredoxin
MIVCVCHGIPCKRIRSVIREGAETVDAVGAACGAGTDCGSCREMIEDLIEEAVPTESRARSRLPMLMTG